MTKDTLINLKEKKKPIVMVLKYEWKCRGPKISKAILKRTKSKLEDLILPDFNTSFKAMVIKMVRNLYKDQSAHKSMEQKRKKKTKQIHI